VEKPLTCCSSSIRAIMELSPLFTPTPRLKAFHGGDAVEGVVGEGLRAVPVLIVGDDLHVAVVVAAGVEEIVAEIHDVRGGGRGGLKNESQEPHPCKTRKDAPPRFNFQKNLWATRRFPASRFPVQFSL